MKALNTTTAAAVATILTISGCAAPGQQHRANVYKAGQVNQMQEAKMVNILAVLPAQIEVDNSEQKKQAQIAGAFIGAILGGAATGNNKKKLVKADPAAGAIVGGVAGAAAGSLVADTVLVDGVSITYTLAGQSKPLNSAQVGRVCEYKIGSSVMISTGPNETRIQPNKECPVEEKKG